MNEAIRFGRVFADDHFFAVNRYHIFRHCFTRILFTARATAIASDLSYVLLRCLAAMIAAKIFVRPDRAITYFVSAFTAICHDIYSFSHSKFLTAGALAMPPVVQEPLWQLVPQVPSP